MNLYAFTLVATCAAMGNLRIRWNAVLRLAVITTLIMGGLIVGARIGMGALMGDAQIARQTLAFMTIDSAVDVVVHKTLPPDLVPADPNRPRLDQILERGTLRIGFNPNNLPFSYLNQDGELVGHDVELMYELARGAELGLEFIPWDYDNAKERMNGGLIDIAIGGLMITPTRLKFLDFSKPYMELTASVLVPDHDRHDYGEWAQIGVRARTRLGVVGRALALWADQLANVDVVNLDSMSDYVEGNSNGLDGVIVSAEAGSAWTILHPDYAVAIPRPFHRIPVALPVPRSEPSLRTYLDSWIDILEATDRLDELYDKWILGKGDVKKKRRWCIYDDVLGWGDAVDSDPASSR
jgi:ABC-type amino acid transport substrate-binding protein